MARDIDEKKKRKALRKLRKAVERADADNGPGLSDWEREFVDEVEMRVEKYGSAFADPEKGNPGDPLSALQARKLKEIDRKSRGKATSFKGRSGFSKSKNKQGFTPRSRDINDDIDAPADPSPRSETPVPPHPKPKMCKLKLVTERQSPVAKAEHIEPEQNVPAKPTPFRVIRGGKET